MRNNLKFLIVASCALVLFLASSIEIVRAAYPDSDNEIKLPDFLIKNAEYMSRGNSTRFVQIIEQMIKQEKIKQERIESTKGAVLDFKSVQDSLLLNDPPTWSYINEYEFHGPDPEHTTDWQYVENWEEIEGSEDDSFAHLHTTDWNHDYQNPQGIIYCWRILWESNSKWRHIYWL
jgi:hypothetical protein